jgi:hypothetical protein
VTDNFCDLLTDPQVLSVLKVYLENSQAAFEAVGSRTCTAQCRHPIYPRCGGATPLFPHGIIPKHTILIRQQFLLHDRCHKLTIYKQVPIIFVDYHDDQCGHWPSSRAGFGSRLITRLARLLVRVLPARREARVARTSGQAAKQGQHKQASARWAAACSAALQCRTACMRPPIQHQPV